MNAIDKEWIYKDSNDQVVMFSDVSRANTYAKKVWRDELFDGVPAMCSEPENMTVDDANDDHEDCYIESGEGASYQRERRFQLDLPEGDHRVEHFVTTTIDLEVVPAAYYD